MSDKLLMPDGAVASVVSPRVLATTKEIDIPDVQRGLVWNPTQIAELWKSIFEGYPIGALTVYKQEDRWQLIDGQQRWHAIKLGLHPDEKQKAMTILWTVWEKKQDKWEFKHLMVSTRRHPWGFVWNKPGDRLERLSHPEMIAAWDNMLPIEKRKDSFELPTLEKAQNYLKLNSTHKWIPLHELLSEEHTTNDNIIEANIIEAIRNSEQVKVWRKRVESPFIPLIRFNLQENVASDQNQENVKSDRNQENVKADRNRIHELFTRINKGGTQISPVDYTYSTLCSYLGKEFKDSINEIAENFMPPNRVARLYARLKYAEDEEKRTSGILLEPPHSSYWNGKKYDAEIGKAIAAAKSMYSLNGIPQTVYLQASGDEWLTVVAWCMLRFRDSDIISKSEREEKNLLCMLPYVVCRDPGYHAHFCNRFYEALKDIKDMDVHPASLMEMLAIGVAYAACYSIQTGMYPITELKETIELQQEYPYDKEWLYVLCDSKNEPLLHFLQKTYMNRMLQSECGFYPHETATWGEDMNRPWDDDHIVPQSRWWLLQQDELMFRESLPNKQMLYYRLNRKKKDYYIGVPADDGISPEDDFCYSGAEKRETKTETKTETYFGWEKADVYRYRRPARLHQTTADTKRAEYEGYLATYKVVVNKRFSAMIQRLFDYLPLVDLIRAINALPEASGTPPCLQMPIALWNVLKGNKDFKDLTWCSVRHDQSKQQVIETKDFYHSLCHWLAVGKEVEGTFRCVCWHLFDAKNLHIEEGCRRLPNQTLAEWKNGSTQDAPRNDWWVEKGFSASTLTNDLREIEIQKKLKDISAQKKLISYEQ